MQALAAAFSLLLSLPALAGEYVVRDACPTYRVTREAGVVTVRCATGKPTYRLPGVCGGGPVEYWMRGGSLWLWCRGQPRPRDAM